MSQTEITDEERLHRLRLIRSDHVGPLTFRRLMERFGSAAEALAALPDLARRGGLSRPLIPYPKADAERELTALAALGARLVAIGEPGYPPLLGHVDDAPPLLAVLGDHAVLARPIIGVVGTRNASVNGRGMAARLAAELGQAGVVVISGLARGIDTAAHRAALPTGTVAAVAGGADVIYPAENGDLYRAIIDRGGAVISEMPPGTQPQARHFPRRNRMIAGAALGVVVVEAALRSGSMITARLALEQGREVFAVPGSPLDPRARGANDLIRQGAVLTETAEDIVRALPALPALDSGTPVRVADRQPGGTLDTAPGAVPERMPELECGPQVRAAIAEALSPAPATVDEIVRSCQLSPAVVAAVLLEWELAGRLERHAGNRVSLIG
ncbi:MAG: DNA-protecting protein DprA [Rhodospirillales bacterium]|nr:MAG: DNA-protecting protein DprA [Rhodospirillales bacterium]